MAHGCRLEFLIHHTKSDENRVFHYDFNRIVGPNLSFYDVHNNSNIIENSFAMEF